MKKLISVFGIMISCFFVLGTERYTLRIDETFSAHDVDVKLCSTKQARYVLVVYNNILFMQSLVVYETKQKTARNAYGEVYLKYYNVKHGKKKIKTYDGKTFEIYEDNEKAEKKFMQSLTDIDELKKYPSFSFIDNNEGKKEKVDEDEEIGSSAGYLMQINAEDFINYVGSL